MPIFLRNFTFKLIEEHYEKEQEEREKSSGRQSLKNTPPKGPDIRKADYTTKASK